MSEMIMSMVRELILEGEAEDAEVEKRAGEFEKQASKVGNFRSRLAKEKQRNA